MNLLSPVQKASSILTLMTTRHNRAKLIVKNFNASVAQHFHPIKITTTWNSLPTEVVSSRTVKSFKNNLDKHWGKNPTYVRVNWEQSSMPCTFKGCSNSHKPAFSWKGTQRFGLLFYYYINILL